MDTTSNALLQAAKKELESLFALIKEQKASGCHVFVHASAGSDRLQKWRRLKFSPNLSNGHRGQILSHLASQLTKAHTLVAFDFADIVQNHVAVWNKGDIPELSKWLEQVPPPEWPHLFDGSVDYLKGVKFYVSSIPITPEDNLTIYRQHGIGSFIKKGLATIFHRASHEFNEVDGDIIFFDTSADFFEWRGYVFVIRQPQFEALTNMRQVTFEKAVTTLKKVASLPSIDIANLGDLGKALEKKPAWLKKLAAADRHGTIAALSAKGMIERIKNKGLPIPYTEDGETIRFKIDPKNARQLRTFVELITDTILQSTVTSLEYRVHSKEPA